MNRGGSIRTLNSFLRGEIAAVASYRLALAHVVDRRTEAELRACLASHEEGEDRGLERYLHDVGKLDQDSRRIVGREILPEQVRTHDWLSDLKLRDAGLRDAG